MKDAVNFAFLLGDVVRSRTLSEAGRIIARQQCADEGNSYRVRYAQDNGDTFCVWYPEHLLQLDSMRRVG